MIKVTPSLKDIAQRMRALRMEIEEISESSSDFVPEVIDLENRQVLLTQNFGDNVIVFKPRE